MEWPLKRFKFSDDERAFFGYATTSTCTIVKVRAGDSADITKWDINSTEDLVEWVEKLAYVSSSLANRPKDSKPGGCDNPALLRHLPFCKNGFDMILRKFHVHGSIKRIILRGRPIFSRTYLQPSTPTPEEVIVYNYRTRYDWPGHLAMSMTYFVKRKVTCCVLFGCDEKTKRDVLQRLHNSEDSAYHPLLLIGVLTELERRRLLDENSTICNTLTQATLDIRKPAGYFKSPRDGDMGVDTVLDPWLETYFLKIGFEAWKDQLPKVIAHIDELSQAQFNDDYKARKAGERIKDRILEIIYDYDETIRECDMNLESLKLANKLAIARANIERVASAKTVSNRIRSIALLTIVFLPVTFVASFFSTTSSSRASPQPRSIVPPMIWMYFIIAAILTLIAARPWATVIQRERQRKNVRSVA
ncbi:hypothetical protein F5Y10DRAFT_265771 [Nemania abortiva]|nr:hypothetical protein F5Y10DRAFT_265771 [Nemania abortiva]